MNMMSLFQLALGTILILISCVIFVSVRSMLGTQVEQNRLQCELNKALLARIEHLEQALFKGSAN